MRLQQVHRVRYAGGVSQMPNQALRRAILADRGRPLAGEFANLGEPGHVRRHPKSNLTSTRITVSPDEGEGYWEISWIRNDIYVEVANIIYHNPREVLVRGNGFLTFLFKISGDMVVDVGSPSPFRWNRPSLVVWSQPVGIDIRDWLTPNIRERYIAISVRPAFLTERFFMTGSDVPEPLLQCISKRRDSLCYSLWPLDAHAFELATKLFNNPYTGALAFVHTEAIVSELLCSALGRLCLAKGATLTHFTERELRCLHAARSMLMQELSPVPTIARIARSVGMSECVLTKAFKSLFGETIFEFSLHCRMTHALTLMRDHGSSVERAAEAVGYAHPTSFATAFRRYFGMRPIDLRSGRFPLGHRRVPGKTTRLANAGGVMVLSKPD